LSKVFRGIARYGRWILMISVYLALVFIFVSYSKYSESSYYFDDKNIQEWNEDWEIHFGNNTVESINLPAELPVKRGETVILRNVLPDKIKTYNCLMIVGRRQDIEVSINGIRRASFSNKNNRPWGNSSPSGIVLVPLYNTDDRADIAISLSSSSIFSGKIGKVYLGNEKSLVLMMLRENALGLAVIILISILGLVCAVNFFTYINNFEITKAMGHLAWFALLAAVWGFSQSGLRQLFFDNLALLEDIGYCTYMLLPIPIIVYIDRIVDGRYKKSSEVVICLSALNFLVENIIQYTLGIGFYEMRFATQAVLLICIIIGFHICTVERHNSSALLSRYLLVGVTGLLFALLLEITYQNIYLVTDTGAISGAIYAVCLAIFLISGFLYTLRCVSEEQKIRKDAESANRAKTDFLATMSHEIKTPINAMLGMNEMILRDSVEDTIREYSANIDDAGKSLLSLVNDILDYSKIESGKMEIVSSNYQLKPILRNLISMTKGKIQSNDISFILDIEENLPSVYFGDGIRLKQVLSNLLTNAAKYTKTGSITFGVTSKSIKDDEIELFFSIKDTGIGIKEKDIEKITESFSRSEEETNSSIAGTGLGLAITKQLLELMGSKLEVESVLGSGSDFYFTIRQRIVDVAPLGSLNPKAEGQKNNHKITFTAPSVRILAVDDTVMNLKVLSHLLKPTKINLDTCVSGEASLKLCKDNKYDLIIMDHMMPQMDGIEAYRAIRADKTLASTNSPIIVLTANTVSGAEEMYREVGFDYYMKKPVDVSELNEVLLRFLPSNKIEPMVIE